MKISDYITSKLGRPTGIVGALLAWRMARANAFPNELTLDALELRPTDHVLEVGFGPGAAITKAAERAAQGFVAGVDFTQEMVEMATRRNRRYVEAGRVELRCASMEALPYPDERFDKLYTVNTIYFWQDPAACLREARRVLKTGGTIGIGLRAKDTMKGPVNWSARVYSLDEVKRMLLDNGFRDPRVKEGKRGKRIRHCVCADK